MKHKSFLRRLGDSWLDSTFGTRRVKKSKPRLCVESLEERNLMSVLPAPIVSAHIDISQLGGNESNASVAIDPINGQKLVTVYTVDGATPGQPPKPSVRANYSTDGGKSWQTLDLPANLADPVLSTPAGNFVPFAQTTNASVAFNRNNEVYIAYSEHSSDNVAEGLVILRKYDFTGGAPVALALSHAPQNILLRMPGQPSDLGYILYDWAGGINPVYNPVVTVDSNVPSFTDPTTGQTQTDPYSGTVYVAWNTNAASPSLNLGFSPAPLPFNPVTIQLVASQDGGNDFTGIKLANVGLQDPNTLLPIDYAGNDRDILPHLVVSQGTADGRVSGGQLNIVWDDFADSQISANRVKDGGAGLLLTNTQGGAINDGISGGTGNPDITGFTTFNINVAASDFQSAGMSANDFINQLTVGINLVHPALAELDIKLVAPDNTVYRLVSNRTDNAGNSPAGGIPKGFTSGGANLGLVNFTPSPFFEHEMGFYFDASASQNISDPAVKTPYVGHFRPELTSLSGLSISQANAVGTWKLVFGDHRNSGTIPAPGQFLLDWSLNFTARLDRDSKNRAVGTPVIGPSATALLGPNQLKTPAAPDQGVSPEPSIASDNTLGSFSPYEGRLYVAYTSGGSLTPIFSDDTNITLAYSDDGGVRWVTAGRVNNDSATDNVTEGNRPQFNPAVAVDQVTGTVVVSFSDARNDAAHVRVAEYLATSIDGGVSFGPEVFVNTPVTATDAITGKVVTIEPLPDNMGANNPDRDQTYGLGHQGLAVLDGHVTPVWAGDGNRTTQTVQGTADILSSVVEIAAGPRIIGSTQGPVSGSSLFTTVDTDGTQLADRFEVQFDRPVDPATFTPADVTVIFRDPFTLASLPGISLLVTSVTPEDAGQFGPNQAAGATKFLVRFDPARRSDGTAYAGTHTGTYSYAVGPNIFDRIRAAVRSVAAGSTLNFDAAQLDPSQVNLRIPPDGSGGGSSNNEVTESDIVITNVPNSQAVTKVTVTVNLTHSYDSDLVLTLVAPDGTKVVLSRNEGGSGSNYTNTTFDDAAGTPISQGTVPFTGTFRPDSPLNAMIDKNLNGKWKLLVDDTSEGDTGTLLDWQLHITTGTPAVVFQNGNAMDQNANAAAGENPPDLPGNTAPTDVYATPTPINPTPFIAPYDQNTLPIIVPGPHIVSTQVPGQPPSADNLVFNGTTNTIDVAFDRDMLASTFTPAQVLRIMGPNAQISGPFTVTADPFGTGDKRTFRIGFALQKFSGTYSIVLGTGIQSVRGENVDANLNAGVDILRDVLTPTGSTTTITRTSATPAVLNPGKVTISTLSVPDNLVIQGLTVRLNITYPNDPDLTAVLIGPDGTSVRLFTKVGVNAGPNGSHANFADTVFDDNATTPIQNGLPPFNGTFNPQQPLNLLVGKAATGTYTLVITDSGTGTVTGLHQLNNWSLSFTKAIPGTGLGEAVADQETAHFRIFNEDPTNPIPKQEWTGVGPASIDHGAGSGRVTGLAVDSSDPSGNTVYVGGASGGVWKTSNFLTTEAIGPTWIPLTDFGPTNAINIGGIAVFSRNNDPNQSIVFAVTGEGDTGTPGVGFLRSLDGGAHWTVLDSTTNVDANGNLTDINSPLRDHKFVGNTSFKVLVDPTLSPAGEVVVYAAMSGANGGIWRSLDTGKHWTLMRAGQATDVIFALDSPAAASKNLQIVYAAFRGEGVFLSPNQGATWNLMSGGVGDPLIQDALTSNPIPVNAPSSTPNGAKGRIVLASPALTGNALKDKQYEGWLYAAVSTTGGTLDGLYLTKDFGQNWTKLVLPTFTPIGGAFGTNDETKPSYDPLGHGSLFAQGNYDISLTVDPTNPNIAYLGGTRDGALQTAGGLIRVDATTSYDPHALVSYANYKNDGGLTTLNTIGAVQVADTTKPDGFVDLNGNLAHYLNLIRDPDNPFLTNATLSVFNEKAFTNNGTGVRWMGFNDALDGTTDQHRVFSFVDPLTGHARLIFTDDQGVFTGVDQGDGTLSDGIGSAVAVTGTRNGNLQLTQFYQGASQPSLLASEIAGALFYGNAQDNGQSHSTGDILSTGDMNWTTFGNSGDGTGIATDQVGSGTAYTYGWPGTGAGTNFFGVTLPGAATIGRTFGLLQQSNPGPVPDPQWPALGGFKFGVNPINGSQIVMSSAAGRVFRTQDQGVTWFPIGEPTDLDSTNAQALAYGSPDPSGSNGNLDNFIYAGTVGGHIFVTFTGGGAAGTGKWINLSAGLDGSAVQEIVTNPTRGSHEAYAVTTKGVYHMVDSKATGATWVNITANVFNLTESAFFDSTLTQRVLQTLSTIVADWRYTIPNNPSQPTGPSHPILYVGGNGGVYRSKDNGATWTIFPDVAHDGSASDGGFLPVVNVTQLSLTTGDINPTTGQRLHAGAPDVLVATTFGRGAFAIRLTDVGLTSIFGPRVVSVTPAAPMPANGTFGTVNNPITVTFNEPVYPPSVTATGGKPSPFNLTNPFGAPISPLTVINLHPSAVDSFGNPDPLFNEVYQITFAAQTAQGVYNFTVSPTVTDLAGILMDQNQNGIGGERPGDVFSATFTINTNDDAKFIAGLYQDVLGRFPPDTAGFLAQLGPVDTARFNLLPAFALGFLQSDEYHTHVINNDFQTFLRRPASSGDVTAWLNAFHAGLTHEQFIASLVGSGEYFQNVGSSDNTKWAEAVIHDILGRPSPVSPNDPAVTFVLGQLNSGQTRTQVGLTLATSFEYRHNVLVPSFYSEYLGRTGVSEAEITGWINALQAGRTDESIASGFVGSMEYFGNPYPGIGGGNSNLTWFESLYTNPFVLGRNTVSPTDPGLINNLTGLLSQYAAQRQAVATTFVTSDEFRGNRIIRDDFQTFLRRAALQSDVNTWLPALRAGMTQEQFISNLVGSGEYFQNVAGGSNKGWVDAAFQDILKRAATASDEANFVAALNAGGSRTQLALNLLSSFEYRHNVLVPSLFSKYLYDNVPAPAAGVDFWTQQMMNGATDNQVIISFLTSSEYFLNVPHPIP